MRLLRSALPASLLLAPPAWPAPSIAENGVAGTGVELLQAALPQNLPVATRPSVVADRPEPWHQYWFASARELIRQGHMVLDAVDFVRAPRTKDKRRSDNDAYARIQYLLPVPGGRRLAFNDIRGILYLTDMQGTAPKVYLDLRRENVRLGTMEPHGESGLMGFAFHPEFATPDQPGHGKFYTAFTAARGDAVPDYDHGDAVVDNVVREWTTTDPQAGAFAGTSREVLRVGTAGRHNIGTIAFNSAAGRNDQDYGLLYIGFGDGSKHDWDPQRNSQTLATPLGAIARIDPLDTADGRRYGIPAGNPFVGRANAAPEIYAYGLRHPQQFSWDADGRMFIADIGRSFREEINLGVVGGNYGWPFREGTLVTPAAARRSASPQGDPSSFTCPVAQYPHPKDDILTGVGGGFVYRGGIAALRGKYIFTDFPQGRLLAIDAPSLRQRVPPPVFELRLAIAGVEKSLVDVSGHCATAWQKATRYAIAGKHRVTRTSKRTCRKHRRRVDARLGIDHDGELYVLTKGDGWIRKLVGQANRDGVDVLSPAAARAVGPMWKVAPDAEVLWRSEFNVYARHHPTGGVEAIVLARDRCDATRFVRATFVPADDMKRDLQPLSRRFPLHSCGGCGAVVALPKWTPRSVRVGPTAGGDWAFELLLDAGKVAGVFQAPRCWSDPSCPTNPNIARLRRVHERAHTATPAATATFDVYLSDKSIDYVRSPCVHDDLANRFFLHAFPRDPSDLPLARRLIGFANLDFAFWEHGGKLGDACVATVRLPPWPLRELGTGQFSTNGEVWRVDLEGEALGRLAKGAH